MRSMSQSTTQSSTSGKVDSALLRVGCVSFINAKPLIEGFKSSADNPVRFEVPSGLLDGLEQREIDIALCPVIDYFRSKVPLTIVPSGGIGCCGATMTVRLYSQIPIEQITQVYADTDSHTSVALLRVLLAEQYGIQPTLTDYNASAVSMSDDLSDRPQAMLLIGDKVVTDSPKAVNYPHQLDLGETWAALTGLPFVFAVWMAREGESLSDLPERLSDVREHNAKRSDAIADMYAPKHGWPKDLARKYLGKLMRYDIGKPELTAIERFGALAHKYKLIEQVRPLNLYQ